MGDIFSATIREEANERFKRPCSFSLLHSWDAWALSYDWVDHTGKFHEGDTIAFIERLGWSPYSSLVVGTVADIVGDDCRLAVVSHDAAGDADIGDIIIRSVRELLRGPIKRWPRNPVLPPEGGSPIRLPYFQSRRGAGRWRP